MEGVQKGALPLAGCRGGAPAPEIEAGASKTWRKIHEEKLPSLLLAAAMTVSLCTLPAGAVTQTSRFSDLSDNSTTVTMETLRLHGIMDGYSTELSAQTRS